MTYLQLGNNDVDWIGKKLGIKFSKKDKDFLEAHHSENASFNDPMMWHAFDLPESVFFGSYKLMKIFKEMISHYDVKGNLSATMGNYDYDKLISDKDLTVNGFPKYLVVKEFLIAEHGVQNEYFNNEFYQLAKINKRTLVYKKMSNSKLFYKDIQNEDSLLTNDILIPDFENICEQNYDNLRDLKIRKEELKCDHAFIGEFAYFPFAIADIWDGKAVYNTFEKFNMTNEQYDSELKNHKNKLKTMLANEKLELEHIF